jgi:hypothetical protein
MSNVGVAQAAPVTRRSPLKQLYVQVLIGIAVGFTLVLTGERGQRLIGLLDDFTQALFAVGGAMYRCSMRWLRISQNGQPLQMG